MKYIHLSFTHSSTYSLIHWPVDNKPDVQTKRYFFLQKNNSKIDSLSSLPNPQHQRVIWRRGMLVQQLGVSDWSRGTGLVTRHQLGHTDKQWNHDTWEQVHRPLSYLLYLEMDRVNTGDWGIETQRPGTGLTIFLCLGSSNMSIKREDCTKFGNNQYKSIFQILTVFCLEVLEVQ